MSAKVLKLLQRNLDIQFQFTKNNMKCMIVNYIKHRRKEDATKFVGTSAY